MIRPVAVKRDNVIYAEALSGTTIMAFARSHNSANIMNSDATRYAIPRCSLVRMPRAVIIRAFGSTLFAV